MRIMIVHSYYRGGEPSGENVLVADHAAALKRAGYDVRLIAQKTDERALSALYPIEAAFTVASGFGRSPLTEIAEFRPDIVHVHNVFPNYGRRWVKHVEVPVVHTLHNFRPLCAASTLFRDGHVCTQCPDGDRWAGLRYGCYRGSRAKTLPLALANYRGPAVDPLLKHASAVVVLSDRAREVYGRAGLPLKKLVCIPNFVTEDLLHSQEESKGGAAWLFAGRLSTEKGIEPLVERWPADIPLNVAGQGPLERRTAQLARGKRIDFLGSLSRPELLHLMRTSLGLVFPSRWYEGFPMVYAESLAAGLPTLAFEPSAVADFVRSDGTGLVTSWREDLTCTLSRASRAFPALRNDCRRVYIQKYSERAFVGRVSALYDSLIASTG